MRILVLGVAGLLSIVLAAASIENPLLVVVAFMPLALVCLVQSSWARLGWFVLGGILVFQVSDAVGGPKLAYLGGCALTAIISAARVVRSREPWIQAFDKVPFASGILIVALAVSFAVSSGINDPVDWIRDAFPYLLLVVAPLIALDAAHDVSLVQVERAIAVLGVLSAIGFTLDWLERRGISALPVGRILLGSGCVAALGFSVCLARVATRTSVWRWGIAAGGIPAIMLTTGTRTVAVFGMALGGIVGRRERFKLGISGVVASIVLLGLTLTLLVPKLVSTIVQDPRFLDQRWSAAMQVLSGNGRKDASLVERSESYASAQATWGAHRWTGTGHGYLYPSGGFTLDTPLVTLAKFGVLGTGMLTIFFVILVAAVRGSSRRWGWQPIHNALLGFTMIMTAFLPFGTPLEDKGFAFAIALAICGCGAAARLQWQARSNERERLSVLRSDSELVCEPRSRV
jgi:hypothetical protein